MAGLRPDRTSGVVDAGGVPAAAIRVGRGETRGGFEEEVKAIPIPLHDATRGHPSRGCHHRENGDPSENDPLGGVAVSRRREFAALVRLSGRTVWLCLRAATALDRPRNGHPIPACDASQVPRG